MTGIGLTGLAVGQGQPVVAGFDLLVEASDAFRAKKQRLCNKNSKQQDGDFACNELSHGSLPLFRQSDRLPGLNTLAALMNATCLASRRRSLTP